MSIPNDLLTKVLELDRRDREELLLDLAISLESVDEELTPEDWEASWAEEIDRRLRELDQDPTQTISHEELMARMRQTLAEIRQSKTPEMARQP